jgi:nucleotide-binding universal stress UspA family protein
MTSTTTTTTATATTDPHANTSAGRIVVGMDGSPSSIEALKWADRVGTALDVPIDVVISWEWPVNYGVVMIPPNWQPDVDAKNALTEACDAAFGDRTPKGLRSIIREGQPVQVLLHASQGAEMLVVGSRGHGGFAGLLLGSVSAPCVEHASCPVVVLHAPAHPAGA